jgi:hypothetical protein
MAQILITLDTQASPDSVRYPPIIPHCRSFGGLQEGVENPWMD